jgi:integrase
MTRNNARTDTFQGTGDLQSLPNQVISKDRQEISLVGDVWNIRASSDGGKLIHLRWPVLIERARPLRLSTRSLHIMRMYIARRLTFSKGSTIGNDFQMFARFFDWLSQHEHYQPNAPAVEFEWGHLDDTLFRAFLNHGLKGPSKGNDCARLREFYGWGALIARLVDFNEGLALSLKTIHLQGNVKGAAVRFHDVVKGPFDGGEQRAIVDAVKKNLGESRDRVVIMLFLELGLNPQSAVRMRNSDLRVYRINTIEKGRSREQVKYQLHVPRVKKRNELRETKCRPITRELGDLLTALRTGSDDDPLLSSFAGQESPESAICTAMQRFAKRSKLLSPRTGDRLHLSPRRFRSTLGTEIAREGGAPATIAETLDHTDLQNVDVYVEASSYVVDQLGERFDHAYESVVSSFRGRIVDSRTKSPFSGVPPREIPSAAAHLPVLPIDVGGIGMCGRDVRRDGLCQLAPPLTCYPCHFFAAFRDGPHQQVLSQLEAVLNGIQGSADKRITMQLADVTGALRQLIDQIESETKAQECL